MYPFNEIRKEVVKRSFGRLFDEVLGYLNLYDYLKLKVADRRGTSKLVSIDSFWFSILGDKFARKTETPFASLRSGDIVKLRDVFITEWTPKLPGKIGPSQGV